MPTSLPLLFTVVYGLCTGGLPLVYLINSLLEPPGTFIDELWMNRRRQVIIQWAGIGDLNQTYLSWNLLGTDRNSQERCLYHTTLHTPMSIKFHNTLISQTLFLQHSQHRTLHTPNVHQFHNINHKTKIDQNHNGLNQKNQQLLNEASLSPERHIVRRYSTAMCN